MDTPKFKIKELLTSGLIAFLTYVVLAALCYVVYFSTHLDDLFLIAPTYHQWVGIVFIASILFNRDL